MQRRAFLYHRLIARDLSRAKHLLEHLQDLFLDQSRRDFRCCIVYSLSGYASFAAFYLRRDLDRNTGGSSAMEGHCDGIVLSVGGRRHSADDVLSGYHRPKTGGKRISSHYTGRADRGQ